MANWVQENMKEIARKEIDKENLERLFVQAWIDPNYSGTGNPKVRFLGEDAASGKSYPHLNSYTPAAGDRVILARVGNNYVILGSI